MKDLGEYRTETLPERTKDGKEKNLGNRKFCAGVV